MEKKTILIFTLLTLLSLLVSILLLKIDQFENSKTYLYIFFSLAFISGSIESYHHRYSVKKVIREKNIYFLYFFVLTLLIYIFG
ncbi:membrane hypothetical protein [Tenacibaculum xiamenense]